ncbi:hypothetical protein FOL46_004092 [Perkinsus olseni]|uniref:EamA domain-containing protein n=2 Tax=Perkinsus olseni TaxID=32597 RepID=A0A7J6LZX7_PEROL|nr:hypothetical protein FOL46_004092 [Perkinsus olseni]
MAVSTLGLAFGLGLIVGSGQSISEKLAFQSFALGLPQYGVHLFNKPWFMSLMMFSGMFLALVVFYILALAARLSGKPYSYPTRKTWLAIFFPACFDLVGTSFQAIGLVYTPVSVFQMLKGSIIVFSAALSVIFLKRKMYRNHWAGVLICVIALTLVGSSSIFSRGSQAVSFSVGKVITGICFIIGGQVVCASQYVVEEFLLKGGAVPPLALVGIEGIWGLLVMACVVLPVMQHVPGTDVGGVFENAVDAFAMMSHSSMVLGGVLGYALNTFAYNICAVNVTNSASAIHTTMLDSTRTILIWVCSIIMYYMSEDHAFGEPLTPYSLIQLAGFVLLVYGVLVYDNIVRLPFGLSGTEKVNPTRAPMSMSMSAGTPLERKPFVMNGSAANSVLSSISNSARPHRVNVKTDSANEPLLSHADRQV